jgi:hypothetical protein
MIEVSKLFVRTECVGYAVYQKNEIMYNLVTAVELLFSLCSSMRCYSTEEFPIFHFFVCHVYSSLSLFCLSERHLNSLAALVLTNSKQAYLPTSLLPDPCADRTHTNTTGKHHAHSSWASRI